MCSCTEPPAISPGDLRQGSAAYPCCTSQPLTAHCSDFKALVFEGSEDGVI